MRVLLATTAGAGHFGPMVPFAAACVARGHEVRVAAPVSFAAVVSAAGFAHVPLADAPEPELGAVFARLPQLSLEEANATVMREIFAGLSARAALPGVAAAVEEWRPDVILRETTEFASYVVAERAGIPHVQVAIGLSDFEELAYPLIEDPLAALGSRGGIAGLRDAPGFTWVPQCLEDPAKQTSRNVHRFHEQQLATEHGALGDWWTDSLTMPLVYVTLGTVTARIGMFPDLYQRVIDALAEAPVRVLFTLGNAADPAALAPLPPNIHVENYWPQEAVMHHVAAMVGHGGFGTTMTGLIAGVPMVVLPIFALDQFANGAAVARSGAGIVLPGGPDAALDGLGAALERLLGEPSFGEGARNVAAEVRRLPLAEHSVDLLGEIVRP
jgi:UDP:flavonoid glycosyltransferase YjiC (YdhE family)